MTMYLGVDPGAHGAVALLDSYGCLIQVEDMPAVAGRTDPYLTLDLIRSFGPLDELVDVAVVEQVGVMPGQGLASSGKFMTSYGIVLGVIAGLGLPIVHVTPAKWKRALGLSSDKEQCRRRAIDTFPNHAGRFARKKHADRAEAALIALWGWQQQERAA